ncbi:MAG TPA: anion transporter [Anaerolineaceae bacterium]|nr:anion transporter [Anaerolineaceae bacterium]
MNPWITLAIVTLTYIGIAIGRWPLLKSNRATVALIGVGLLLVTRQIAFNDLSRFLDFDTLILLFAMMVINANLRLCGFFDLVGNALLRLARTPRAFLAYEIVGVGLLSALFLNDTICLMFTPLILKVSTDLKRNPVPYLIALATAANVGSTATLTGNPQNMIVGIASGIPYLDFALALTPVALLGLGGIWLILVLFYPGEFDRQPFQHIERDPVEYSRPAIIKNCLIVTGLLAAFLLGVPIAEAAFLAACLMLITRRVHPHLVFAEFDWSLLVFFSGLFIISGSLEANGLTAQLFSGLPLDQVASPWGLTAITTLLSNLVSNVPAVLLLKPLIAHLPNPVPAWLTLAAASTLAGNLTLLGSVANLIVAETASRWRVTLSFWEYTRAGLLITLISLVLGTLWLQLTLWGQSLSVIL